MLEAENVQALPHEQAAPAEQGEQSARFLSIRQLMWLRFKRNRLAMIGGVILIAMYAAAIFADFLAPSGTDTTHETFVSTPPNGPRLVDADGNFHLQPFVYGMVTTLDKQTFRKTLALKTDELYPVHIFGHGEPYKFWGLFDTDIHLFTV